MKTIALLFLCECVSIAAASQHHQGGDPDKPAVHGMAIFGQKKIYASHLPFFHSPHDYQIILELELTAADKKKFISEQQQHPENATYTIEPEKFILPRKIGELGTFKANLFRGHFERGGLKLLDSIAINIKSVLYFKKFNEADQAANSSFLLFGNSEEQFAIHKIVHQPDFDQILQVKMDFEMIDGGNKCVAASFSDQNIPLGVSGNKVSIKIGDRPCNIILLRQLYLEFDDLRE